MKRTMVGASVCVCDWSLFKNTQYSHKDICRWSRCAAWPRAPRPALDCLALRRTARAPAAPGAASEAHDEVADEVLPQEATAGGANPKIAITMNAPRISPPTRSL